MHLLCHFDTPDFAAWKSAFDDDAEDRMQAGLTLLQMWRSADNAPAPSRGPDPSAPPAEVPGRARDGVSRGSAR